DLVGYVVLLRAEKEVVGIDAGSHVAAVANQKTGGDRAAIGQPGGAVGLQMAASIVQAAVAVGGARPGPQHAAGFGVADAAVIEALLQRPVTRTGRIHGHSCDVGLDCRSLTRRLLFWALACPGWQQTEIGFRVHCPKRGSRRRGYPQGIRHRRRHPASAYERMARTGVNFTNHQCPATMCTSSRSVLVTGLQTADNGMYENLDVPWMQSLSPKHP